MADAFGIEKIIFCGEQIPFGRKMTKTFRDTEKFVTFETMASISELVFMLQKQNFIIISIEIACKSLSIHQFSFSKKNLIALFVGDENFGISEAALECSGAIIHIEMFGKNSSMNVVKATNIALYQTTKQLI